MKIDEILAEMSNLTPQELEAIGEKLHELEVKATKQWLEQRESEPWPPPRNPSWDAFMAWIESQPDDGLPEDYAHNHDAFQLARLRRRP